MPGIFSSEVVIAAGVRRRFVADAAGGRGVWRRGGFASRRGGDCREPRAASLRLGGPGLYAAAPLELGRRRVVAQERFFARRAASVQCLTAFEHGDELRESCGPCFNFFGGLESEEDGIPVLAVERLEEGSGFGVLA
jgi:hypothetical protein